MGEVTVRVPAKLRREVCDFAAMEYGDASPETISRLAECALAWWLEQNGAGQNVSIKYQGNGQEATRWSSVFRILTGGRDD
jgi:hypothetical protein